MKFTLAKNTSTKPFNKHWQFCVGNGHAGLAMSDKIKRMLKNEVQQMLNHSHSKRREPEAGSRLLCTFVQ